MAHHQDSNPAEVAKSEMVLRKMYQTKHLMWRVINLLEVGCEADQMLLNHLKDISSSASEEMIARIKLQHENITVERDGRLPLQEEVEQKHDELFEDYKEAEKMKPRDIIYFGNASVARIKKYLEAWLPFVQTVYPLYEKCSEETKRLLSIPQSDNDFNRKLTAEISKYREDLDYEHRCLNRVTFVKKSLQAAKEIPRETIIVIIGKEAQKIEVGGCEVSIPVDTFTEARSVTVTTDIDVKKWPPGREAITPILFFSAKNLQKPATLALQSWCCLGDDDVDIDLMQLKENATKWIVITPEIMRNELSLEFQSREGGQFIATLRPDQSSSAIYVVQPIIYFKNSNFVVALIRDTELDKNKMMDNMKSDFGDDLKTKHFSQLPCTMTQTINSCIKCVNPSQGFEFVATGSFSHGIEKIIKYSIPSYRHCQLEGDVPKMNVTLEFQLWEGENPLCDADCFQYCLEPESKIRQDESQKDDRTPVTPGSQQRSSDTVYPRSVTKEPRLEDVFTDISSRFMNAQEFEKFACAGTGLSLTFVEVNEIRSDMKTEFGRRVAMVLLWRQKEGDKGTPTKLRKLGDQYFDSHKST